MDAPFELFVVMARKNGKVRETAAFSDYERAAEFADRLDYRGDRDHVYMTSTYLDMPFCSDEMYDDDERPNIINARPSPTHR